jgi:opacity protein-like surface antigen
MKTSLRLAVGCGAIGLLVAFPARAQNSRSYFRADAGPSWTERTEVKEFFGPGLGRTVNFDTGARIGAAGGYNITDWLGAEVETGIGYNKIRSWTGGTVRRTWLTGVPLLANLVLQGPNKTGIVPYVGGGLGVSFTVLDTDGFSDGTTRVTGTDTDAVFAYQAMAGLRYQFNDRMSAGLGYKYLGTQGPSYHAESLSGAGPSGDLRFGRIQSHTVAFVFTLAF